jgi:hypothetical protein|uniref:Uncharacterized protein n=2 Tax=Picea TaxID=3328 RepID=A0A101M207_PICGL|nr:hypothetical protein ABT39_MTgene4008 [Picea glauca]QHR89703.1 hypothetical protein Q903MT_gene3725 [Picea sitchensis]
MLLFGSFCRSPIYLMQLDPTHAILPGGIILLDQNTLQNASTILTF